MDFDIALVPDKNLLRDPLGTAIECNYSDNRANSNTSTLRFSVRCDALTIHILNNFVVVKR